MSSTTRCCSRPGFRIQKSPEATLRGILGAADRAATRFARLHKFRRANHATRSWGVTYRTGMVLLPRDFKLLFSSGNRMRFLSFDGHKGSSNVPTNQHFSEPQPRKSPWRLASRQNRKNFDSPGKWRSFGGRFPKIKTFTPNHLPLTTIFLR